MWPDPLQIVRQKIEELKRFTQPGIQAVQRTVVDPVVRTVQRNAQPVIRLATQNPIVKPIVQTYGNLPPAVRAGINPLSRANVPLKPRPIVVNIGTGLVTDFVVEELANRLLPKEQAGQVADFYSFSSLPFGGPLQRLAAYAVLRPLPAGGALTPEMRDQLNREYLAAKLKAEQEQQQRNAQREQAQPRQAATPSASNDLRIGAPAPAAFQPPTPQPAATSSTRWPSVSAAEARTTLPSPAPQQPVPAVLTPELREVASQIQAPTSGPSLNQIYQAQEQLGAELGAEEMLRRIRESRPVSGIADENFMKWATANPALAYREMLRRESRV